MSQSNLNKFKKPQFQEGMHPVKYFNENPEVKPFAAVEKSWTFNPSQNAILIDKTDHKVMYMDDNQKLTFHSPASYPQTIEDPFDYLCEKVFKGNYRQAIQYIEYDILNKEIPYIRVGTEYFKRIYKYNRYHVELEELKKWNKETIKLDYGNQLLNRIHHFDDFTIEPNNKEYLPIVDGMWNLYQPFPHQAHDKPVSMQDFPVTAHFMAHVFGDQLELGYQYMKVLYEYPKQILPVLTLVSKARQTGKTTFLNWLQMIFGNNYVMVTPDDIINSFNSSYAYKNVIGIDETVVDKGAAVEKIKSIATAKSINVNEKMVAQYQIPFFGHLVITTNRENDFMKVDNEEIRFWVRKLDSIPQDKMTENYEEKLLNEIPFFLRYLQDQITVVFGRSRMVFTKEEIENDQLKIVKKESESWLKKELDIFIEDWFMKHDVETFFATMKDIKEMWFSHNHQVTSAYIKKVLQNEMNMLPVQKHIRYYPFEIRSMDRQSTTGKPYLFEKIAFVHKHVDNELTD